MILYYVRHGSPTYNPDDLTPLGRRQAEAVARRLSQFGIDRVFSSPSNRAVLTARPLCEITHLEPTILDWCNESHAYSEMSVPDGHGHRQWSWQNETFARLFNSADVRALGDKWYEHHAFSEYPQFGEGVRRVNRETDAFFASLGYEHDRSSCTFKAVRHNDERIALFAHEGFSKMFMGALLDIPYPIVSTRLEIGHSMVSVIEFRPFPDGVVIPRVLEYSNDSHLYREALPLKYNDQVFI